MQLQRIVDLKHALLEEGVIRSSYTKSMMIQVCSWSGLKMSLLSKAWSPFSRLMMQVLSHTEAETRWNINSKLCDMASALGHLARSDTSLQVDWLFPSLEDRMLKIPVNDEFKVRNSRQAFGY